MTMSRRERDKQIGEFGEKVAAADLEANGFSDITDLNEGHPNNEYGDILAVRNGERFYISVKARNKYRDHGALNDGFNLVKPSKSKAAVLAYEGKTPDEITQMLFDRAYALAKNENATAAWVTVPVDAPERRYCSYFGLLSALTRRDGGPRRDVPMKPEACAKYKPLAINRSHEDIKPEWHNAK